MYNKILTICMGNRGAIGDSYKNILNSFKRKNNVICIIPAFYEINEFSDDFFLRVKEPVTLLRKKKFNWFFRGREILRFIYFLRKIIKKEKINRIFIYSDGDIFNPILAFFLCDIDISWIVWIHDPILHIGHRFNAEISRSLSEIILFNKVKKFIVSYEDGKRILIKNYKIPKDYIEVVYLPRMKELEFPVVPCSIKYDFIFWGRLEEYKGIELLVKVFNSPELQNLKLLIIGKGKEENSLKRIINNQNNITFVNEYLSNKELSTKIMESRFVILPYKEASGSQTIAIANYYGKIVLATKVGCFNEYIQEGINGFFIKEYNEDEIKKSILYLNDMNENEYNLKIKQHLSIFDLDKLSDKVWKILKDA